MPAACDIDELVAGNGAQPGQERTIVPPGMPLEMDGEERLLDRVVGVARLQAEFPQIGRGKLAKRCGNVVEQTDIGLGAAALRRPHVRRPLLLAILHGSPIGRERKAHRRASDNTLIHEFVSPVRFPGAARNCRQRRPLAGEHSDSLAARHAGRGADLAIEPAFFDCGIAVMAKASAPGRTKTRLVPPLTFGEAAAFNTAFLQDIAANLLAAGESARISGYMAFGPPGSERFFHRHLPSAIGLIKVWFPDFGDCLFAAIRELLERGHGSAVVLNSDSPTLPTALLVQAAELLAQPGDRAVIGPASDGGYYLLGLKQAHRRMFDDIDWSTERVARQTLQRAREIGLAVHVLPTWYDVDDVAALRTLLAELRDGHAFDTRLRPNKAVRTAALIDVLLTRFDLAARLDIAHSAAVEGVAV